MGLHMRMDNGTNRTKAVNLMGLSIAQLHLAPCARRGAEQLQAACPWVVFTSGRRDLDGQAHAMAVNTVQNRHWIGQTYLHAAPLQTWVMEHPDAETVDQLHDGLYQVLLALPDAEVSRISRHLTGDAFDVQPLADHDGKPTGDGQKLLEAMRALPGVERILLKEGGLVRWHIQFSPSVEV